MPLQRVCKWYCYFIYDNAFPRTKWIEIVYRNYDMSGIV